MGKPALLMFLAAALFCVACEDDFSPKSGFTPQLAVFAVLDATQPVQTVRLMWSYDSDVGPVTKPLTDTEVRDAEVKIVRGGETYVFRDTVLTGTDGSKVRAWINRDLRPLPDKEYRLRVTVPGHPDATSTITLPSRLYVRADLIRPDTGIPTIRAFHGVNAFVTRPAAFYFRMWVEVEKWNSGDPIRERREIPLRHLSVSDTWIYSTPEREEETIWSAAMLKRIAEEMVLPTDSISARRVYVTGYALDVNFYSYYKIVRGFEDPRSVRLDRPDISFIDGGLGVFGGMVQDSVVYNYYRFIRE